MQLTTLLASALSLAAGSSAAAIGARQGVDNPRLAQFRIWSADGCDRANEGFYTVETDMANKCHPLNVAPVVSVMLEVWTPAAANCRFEVFTTPDCSGQPYGPNPLKLCRNAVGPPTIPGLHRPTFNAYKVTCA